MSNPDDFETTLANRFISYRPAAHDLFPPPPTSAVYAHAHTRAIRQRTTTALAAAAVAIITVTIGVVVPRGNPDPTPQGHPVASESATLRTSTGSPITTPTPGGAQPSASTRSSGTPNQTGPAVTVRLFPDTVAPGGRLGVAAECGFPPATATAESTAFNRIDLDSYEAGFQSGTATVRSTTKPGTYTVTTRCADGRTGRATLNVS